MAKQLNKETEKTIFDVSMMMFQEKGFAATKLQDIAKKAKMNQSLLHYYFRNKENLFKTVLRYKILQLFEEMEVLLEKNIKSNNEIDLKALIDVYQQFFFKNPNFPMFVISELNSNPKIMKEIFSNAELSVFRTKTLSSIQNAIGKINTNIDSEQILVSLMATLLFPFMAKELLKLIFDKNEKEYDDFMYKRGYVLWEISKLMVNY